MVYEFATPAFDSTDPFVSGIDNVLLASPSSDFGCLHSRVGLELNGIDVAAAPYMYLGDPLPHRTGYYKLASSISSDRRSLLECTRLRIDE